MSQLSTYLRRYCRDEQGAALVEFALILPIMLVLFGLTIEAGRMFWSYQTTIAGVRDATRYVGRAQQTAICDQGSPSLAHWDATVTDIVRNQSDGTPLFPSSITINSVTPTLNCVDDGNFRLASVPIVTVTAHLTITFPFSSLFEFVGASLPTLDTSVSDSGRIFGA